MAYIKGEREQAETVSSESGREYVGVHDPVPKVYDAFCGSAGF